MDEQMKRVIGSAKQKSKRIKKEVTSDVEQESSGVKKRKKSEQNTETVTKDITTSTATIYDGNNSSHHGNNSVNNKSNRTDKSSKKSTNVLDTEASRGKVEIVITDTSTASIHHVTSLDNDQFVVFAYWDACTMPSAGALEYTFKKESCKKLHANHLTNCKVSYVGAEYKHVNLTYTLPDDDRPVRIFKMRPIVPKKDPPAVLLQEMNKTERSDAIRSRFSSKKIARNLAQAKRHALNVNEKDVDRCEKLSAVDVSAIEK